MYGKLIDNILHYAPNTLKLDDGSIIIGFRNSVDVMKAHGYKEVIDNIPEYDSNTEHIRVSGCNETDESIIVNYEICVLEPQKSELEIILEEEVNK